MKIIHKYYQIYQKLVYINARSQK